MPGGWGMYIVFLLPPLVLGLLAQGWVKRAVATNLEVRIANGMSGAEIARAILNANGLQGVPIERSPGGALSDHYDPTSRTVRLSQDIHDGVSVASTAVAAHEVGHAIQHAKAWAPLAFRTALWKPVAFASQAWMLLLFAGFILGALQLVWAAIALYSLAVLFHFVTLPVEFDASRRAGQQLRQLGLVTDGEAVGVRRVLTAAASTYVAGALAALSQLIYYVMVARSQ